MFIPIAIYIHLVHSECITTILCCDLRKKKRQEQEYVISALVLRM